MNRLILLCVAMAFSMALHSQTLLASFEDGVTDVVAVDVASTKSSLFTQTPTIASNPDKTGINTSDKCLLATNVKNADWNGNVVGLKLNTPVKIDNNNRMLSMLVYRTVQAKAFRIGLNGYADGNEVYRDKLTATGKWERVMVDLGIDHLGETINEIYFVYSCNWDSPSSGWGEATYCIDNVKLSAQGNVEDAVVIVDPNVTYQTIHHFGASDCWYVDFVGKYFPVAERKDVAKKLFSSQFDASGNPEGIGLSCWRVNVGAGSADQGDASNIEDPARRAECFLRADGTYDWTKQAGQQYFMQLAKDYGVEHFTLFSNSAPIHFTKNGMANANNKFISCNLTTANAPKFAEFLATVTEHFVDEGYNISLLSPVNEPQYDWRDGQEGSPWDNSDIANLAREVNKSLLAKGLETQILMPEAGQYDRMYSGSFLLRASNQLSNLFGSSSSNYIGNLEQIAPYAAGHSYWTHTTNLGMRDVRTKVRDAAKEYGLGLMQTEWSMLDFPDATTGFPSDFEKATYMDVALFMGKLIYCDMVFADMSAWNYWTALSPEQWGHKNRFYLMRVLPTGGDYGSLTEGGTVDENKNLWALGNYSLFIRPGYKRIELEGASEMNHLLASAYMSPDGNRIVVVYVNNAQLRRFTDISIRNTDKEIVEVRKYVTSSSSNLKLSTTSTSAAHITIPGKSVTTVVIDLKEKSGIDEVKANKKSAKGVYTINGVKVNNVGDNGPGIYIKDGEKVISK